MDSNWLTITEIDEGKVLSRCSEDAHGEIVIPDGVKVIGEYAFEEDIIENYARRHLDIYTCDNNFAHRLHMIAKRYEEYNYSEVYSD